MDYRAPNAGLERRLEELEAELESLRALPPVAKEGPATVSREERELTDKESAHLAYCTRLGVLLVVAGLLVASGHLVLRGGASMTWTRASCSIVEEEEDVHVARYVSHGRTWQFSASGHASERAVACWVPEPPHGGVGRLDEPAAARVTLVEKLSWWWLGSAAVGVFLGVATMFGARHEASSRRRNVIASDDFSSAD